MKPHRMKKLLEMVKVDWLTHTADWDIDRDEVGPMVRGFIETMFFTTELDGSISDVSDRMMAYIIHECIYFYNFNKHILDPLYALREYKESQCGHDFWLSMNEHGAGFFDHGKGHWSELQDSCKRFKPIEDYIYEHHGVIDLDFRLEDFSTRWI